MPTSLPDRVGDGPRKRGSDGVGKNDQATRQVMIDAAVSSILERGFYRASSNEIARRAGVTWGVIQHHFGTREALMLAVLEDGMERFSAVVHDASIDAPTVGGRMTQLFDILASYYGRPEYLAYMQVALNLDHDPDTSAEVRATMRTVAERSSFEVRRLIQEAIGAANETEDLGGTIFLALQGMILGQLLRDALSHDAWSPTGDQVQQQRRLLVEALTPYIEQAPRTKA
ncbi:MAG: regulatory protein TetR [Acidimicrobiales bacterium]|nr:regulatory protein TetR [Acidimicrobiales bacterium]